MKNAGELREFVAKVMEDAVSGKVTADVASKVGKLSSQINESFYAEAKIIRLRMERGEPPLPWGDLPIGPSQGQ